MHIGIFNKLYWSREKQKDNYDSTSYSYFFGWTYTGKQVIDCTFMQIIVVYACVRVQSNVIALLFLHIYKYTNNRNERIAVFRQPALFLIHRYTHQVHGGVECIRTPHVYVPLRLWTS